MRGHLADFNWLPTINTGQNDDKYVGQTNEKVARDLKAKSEEEGEEAESVVSELDTTDDLDIEEPGGISIGDAEQMEKDISNIQENEGALLSDTQALRERYRLEDVERAKRLQDSLRGRTFKGSGIETKGMAIPEGVSMVAERFESSNIRSNAVSCPRKGIKDEEKARMI